MAGTVVTGLQMGCSRASTLSPFSPPPLPAQPLHLPTPSLHAPCSSGSRQLLSGAQLALPSSLSTPYPPIRPQGLGSSLWSRGLEPICPWLQLERNSASMARVPMTLLCLVILKFSDGRGHVIHLHSSTCGY